MAQSPSAETGRCRIGVPGGGGRGGGGERGEGYLRQVWHRAQMERLEDVE